MNTQFLTKPIQRHERKASWTVIALAIIGVAGNYVQGRYSSGDRSALWTKISQQQQQIEKQAVDIAKLQQQIADEQSNKNHK